MRIDVIIPVGPGHEQLYKRAANSIGIAARYYFTRFPDDVVSDIRVKLMDDTEGKHGRAKTRNDGVKESNAEWLFFLDADDEMHPEAICRLVEALKKDGSLDALFGLIVENAGQWLELPRTQVPELFSYDELIAFPPHMTLQMGHFVRRQVAESLPFDESLDAGEDFDYYLRLWKGHRCRKIGEPIMINHRGQHSTGMRSATGSNWVHAVSGMLKKAREAKAA